MPRLFSFATFIIVKLVADILHCSFFKWLPSNSAFGQLFNFVQMQLLMLELNGGAMAW